MAHYRPLFLCVSIDQFFTSHVTVLVAESLGLAESNSIDDTGMVQCIRDDGVLVREDRFKDSSVGVKARCVENGVFCAIELCDLVL